MARVPPSVTILGAGITSLSLAYRLTTLAPATKVTIVEASDRVGGWMKTRTVKQDGGEELEVAIEEGPRSVRPKGGLGAARMLGLVKDLELTDSLLTVPITHASAANRFLLYPSTSLLKLPSSLLALLNPASLLSRPLISSVLREPTVKARPVDQDDESVDSFVRRRFGSFIADSLLSAMVHGIYATDSRLLSIRSAFPYLWEAEKRRGSVVMALIRGLGKETDVERDEKAREDAAWEHLGEFGKRMRKGISVWGLRDGLGTMAQKLEKVLREERGVTFQMGTRVEKMQLKGDQGVEITTSDATFTTPLVISTLSSTQLDRFLPSAHQLPHLTANPSATVSVVTLVFPAPPSDGPKPAYHPDGFGYLVPRSNQSNPNGVLGVVFDSSAMGTVDPPAVQEKVCKFTLMIGGPHYIPPSALKPPADSQDLIPIALAHLRETLPDLPDDLEPIIAFAETHKDCIPTYAPGHGARMRELCEKLAASDWSGKLMVAGASYGGVSLNDCVNGGMTLAERIVEAEGGTKVVTGLERWATWEPYTPTPASKLTSSVSPRLHRSYSHLVAAPSRSGARSDSRLSLRASLLPPRSSIRSSLRQHTHVRPASSVPPTPSTSTQAKPPLPPWNQPSADLRPREVPWIFRMAWKGIKAYLLLCLLFIGFVLYGNSDYIIQAVLKAGSDPKVNEYRAPAGTKVIKLEDVKGVDEAKEEMREFVEFLKDPMKFASLGGRPNKGILLAGPPGTGKTMLARAVANEAGVPFYYASGSEFEDKYVGVGAQKVKKLFSVAKENAPAIIFIDELDTIGGSREQSMEGDIQAGGARGKQTLNMLLTEMDGFSASDDVVVMAATNFRSSLDAALTRPGRFDRHVDVPLPDVQGRLAILNQYMGNIKAAEGLDLMLIARGTPGTSGADLENIVNQAAVRASKEGDWAVRLKHLDWAKDRSLMGVERKSRLVSEESLKTSAYIEAGHALVALKTPHSVPLHKVSILPRGDKLSVTSQVPGADQDSISKVEYLARLDVAVAGRIAEDLVFSPEHVSDRTQQDLQRATRTADAMVRRMGFSDALGLVSLDDDDLRWSSKAKKSLVESEIQRMILEASDRARTILTTNRSQLESLASALREHETLSAFEVKQAVNGEKIIKVAPPPSPPKPEPVKKAAKTKTMREEGESGSEGSEVKKALVDKVI